MSDREPPAQPAAFAELAQAARQAMLGFWNAAATNGEQALAPVPSDPAAMMAAGAEFWRQGFRVWQDWTQAAAGASTPDPASDKRFRDAAWREPPYDALARAYLATSQRLIEGAERASGLDAAAHERLTFSTRLLVDALSPSNFPFTNPQVIKRTAETGGRNLTRGLEHLLHDLGAKQLTHTRKGVFEIGRNIATTPGKVVYETPLFQLIHYAPTTDDVFEVPLVIFPPWINRFYILDLSPEKSFVRWAVEQGLSVFMVSWRSADESIRDVGLDDYVAAQVEAADVVRDLLDVPAAHAIGYCVAGTTLAATLALLEARGEADKIASATFFTAQVDFEEAGELKTFLGDDAMRAITALGQKTGTLDGRYMALAFNLLRGRDLIWANVVDNYMLGNDHPEFDLLHWNGDVTDLPAAWHLEYLETLYRGNRLATAGGIVVDGVPIDLGTVQTPTYVQAGREDHIAPAASVWKITHHFRGSMRFVLAGSGHIAGVVNPPSSGKYGYWTNEDGADSLEAFVAGATEHRGSWWPDWFTWLQPRSGKRVGASGARLPGGGKLAAIEDAPGRYVRTR